MSFEHYRFIHFAGIFLLFFGLGNLFSGQKSRFGGMFHGLGLLCLLLGGFGMHARMVEVYKMAYGTPLPLWFLLKIGLWLIFGMGILAARKRIISPLLAGCLCLVLAMSAFYLASHKPALGQVPAAQKAS